MSEEGSYLHTLVPTILLGFELYMQLGKRSFLDGINHNARLPYKSQSATLL
jgi:hypothetical protein